MSNELDNVKKYNNLIKNLYDYCKYNLKFTKDAKISFIINKTNAENPLGKTAHYDPDKCKVSIYIHNRHIKDILRSLAHELVHHNQNCRGDLNNVATNENYAQNDTHLREMEREAYEIGNMLFRDWEDNIKSKEENSNG